MGAAVTAPGKHTMKTILSAIAAAAILATTLVANAGEPVCKKTVTTETRADGATVIRVHTVCAKEAK